MTASIRVGISAIEILCLGVTLNREYNHQNDSHHYPEYESRHSSVIDTQSIPAL
jgi:hypothetical protein